MEKFVNNTGYTKGTISAENPFNIIPSNNITMKRVEKPIYAIPYYNGQPGEMVLMEPEQEYDFSGADYVMEIPAQEKMQFGGYTGTAQYGNNGNTYYNNNNPYFTTNPTPQNIPMEQLNPQTWDTWSQSPEGQSWMNTPAPAATVSQPIQGAVNMPEWYQNNNPFFTTNPGATKNEETNNTVLSYKDWQNQSNGKVNVFNPYAGSDIESTGFRLGENIGQKNALGAALAGSQVLMGLSRNVLSGLATGKASRDSYEQYRKRQFNQSNNFNEVLKEGGEIHPIPKRPTYMQEGGKVTNAHLLTGEYRTDQGEGIEMERGEIIKNPNGQIQEISGEKHSNGGTQVNAEDGTQVISDFTKIGGDNARHFRKEYNIEVKATDTFATVIDKYSRKLGLKKLVDEEAELLTEVETQLQKEESDTQKLNLDFLSGKLQEVQEKKFPLEEMRKLAFDDVFKRQEKIPKKKEDDMEMGGVVELASKYNISPEKAKELIERHRQTKTMQTGGQYRIASQYEDPAKYVKQSAIGEGNYYGEILAPTGQGNYSDVLQNIQYLHPELFSQNFTEGSVAPTDTAAYQKAINAKYDSILADASKLYANQPEKISALQAQIEQDRFLQDNSVRGIEGKFGNYTSTRPNYALELLPPEELKKAQDAGINTVSQLRSAMPDLYKQYVEPTGVTSDAFLGAIPTPAEQPTPVAQAEADVLNVETGGARTVIPQLPGRYILPPSPFQVPYKGDVNLTRIDPVKVSVEPNLVEAERQRVAASENLSFLPDSQRAAALAQILGQTQNTTNTAISQAEGINAQAQNQANVYNAQISDKEKLLDLENALSYEGRVFGGMNAYEAGLRRYYEQMNLINEQNFRDVNNLNLINSKYDNFRSDGGNVFVLDDGTRLQLPTGMQMDMSRLNKNEQKRFREYQRRIQGQ